MSTPSSPRPWISRLRLRAEIIAAAFFVLVLATGAVTHAQAQAPTFTVLYSFTGSPDGNGPYLAALILDKAGNLYGTTNAGGTGTCSLGRIGPSPGCGTVFKLDTAGNETVLHSFTGSDGSGPAASLIMDTAGNLYGTTSTGGAFNSGTVFKLDPSGRETVLHSFTGPDGGGPDAGLIMDNAGNLYGTTSGGGSAGVGTVFKIDTSGNETVLYSFKGGTDGARPEAGLIMDQAGNLYGTTLAGGTGTCSYLSSGCGTIFKLDTSGKETVLQSFTGSPVDGANPFAALTLNGAGNLYGTTLAGGPGTCNFSPTPGCGTVFKLDASGNETVLHSFTGIDGGGPLGAALIMDTAGNLYGTTFAGGNGPGTVFKLDTSGSETVLHNFTIADGSAPAASLIMDTAGNLYGTTIGGGPSSNCPGGCGTVFKLTVQTPAPTINSISPTSAIAGGAAFTLTVNGTNFVSGSTVNFNGKARTTTFVGATQLTAAIPASDIAIAGTFNMTVTNPGGGTSNAVSFTVVTPEQATQTIINSVNALFSQGVINGGQDNSLVAQLQHAIVLMNAGKNAGAIGNLDSFIGEVNDLLSSGVLSASQAASLISAAESVIAAL
jgi:uncharacterized repeat protein (TIGR03803 family)